MKKKIINKLITKNYEIEFTIKEIFSLKNINHYQFLVQKITPLLKNKKFILKTLIKDLKIYLEKEYPIRLKRYEFFINIELRCRTILALDRDIITLKVQKYTPNENLDLSFINVKKKFSPTERGLRYELNSFKKLNQINKDL